MELDDKVEFWLNNLKVFALNSEVQCSREGKLLGQELIGTRHVNVAFNDMIKHMHSDLGFEYREVISKPQVIEGGCQILLFSIGDGDFYTDISGIHEILTYPTKNYVQYTVEDNSPMVGILNWYEGLIPVIQTHDLIKKKSNEENFLLVYDIGKEIYGLTVTNVYAKHEIERSLNGSQIDIDGRQFSYLDFSIYATQLFEVRLTTKL